MDKKDSFFKVFVKFLVVIRVCRVRPGPENFYSPGPSPEILGPDGL